MLKDKHIAIKRPSLTQQDLTEHVTLTRNGNITKLNKYKVQTVTLWIDLVLDFMTV